VRARPPARAPPARGEKPLPLVGVLKGAVVFLADLLRALSIPATMDFISIVPYGQVTASGVWRIRKDLDEPRKARTCSWSRASAQAGSASPISCATFRREVPPPSRRVPSWPSGARDRRRSPWTTWGERFPTSSWSATASMPRSNTATCPISPASPERVTSRRGADHARAMDPRRRAAGIIALGLLTLCAAVPPTPAVERPEVGETIVKRGRVASDLYAFGGGVDVGADVNGDLIAGGGLVTTSHRVQGDLIVGAGSVMMGGVVEKGVRAAGGSITIPGPGGPNVNKS